MRYLVFYLLAATAFAGEQIVLQTGATIAADRHVVEGDQIRLHTGNGVIELPASFVNHIETIETVNAAAPAPAAEVPAAPLAPATPAAVDPKMLVSRAAEKWGLPPALLHSVAKVESGYRADAVSPKGAIGIMQLMPATAALLEADPRDPAQNVDAAARHLRDLLIQYNGQANRALAAYNAGAAAVERYDGIPPYAETQSYVSKVIRNYLQLQQKENNHSVPAAGPSSR